jgi:two-component system, cell cycle sensor histidine kinase and response regulator CckA
LESRSRISSREAVLVARSKELTAQLELALDAIFARDANRRITFWNKGAQNIYGFSLDEAIGSRPEDLLRTEYPVPLEQIERIVTETGSWEGELVQHTRDERRLVVESRWAAQYDDDGRLAGLLEVNRDITARLEAQAALLEFAPDAFVGVNRVGIIALVNVQAESLFGYGRAELVGRPVEMLVPEGVSDVHAAHRAGYMLDPATRQMGVGLELYGCRLDGSEFPVEISLASVESEGGPLVIAAIRDVSDRVAAGKERETLRARADRERLRNQVQQAHRLESLGQLAGGIAHDFNNLLAVIINYTAFVSSELETACMLDGEERWKTAREDLQQVRLAGERAAQLTHQLLAFARREVVQPVVVDVNEVVEGVEQLLLRTLGEHIELHSELSAGLPSVLIDPGQLEQILVNMAVNARDAMSEGGMLRIDTGTVEINEEYAVSRPELAPGTHVRLRISDNGEGMPVEVLERVFDPFFTTKPQGEGTGLGLATVYGIVKQAGGDVQVYSEPSVGTTFTVLLPATGQSAEQTPARPEIAAHRGDETVLLVEDEDALREVIRRVLAAGGYQVLSASGGAEALKVAAAHAGPIQMLLTDVIMPQMSGPQLAEQMQGVRPQTEVLFMSGFAQPILDSTEMLQAGVSLIEKPFAGPDLLAKIDQVLEPSRGL